MNKVLTAALQRWHAVLPALPVKWIRPENLHLTFRFLGETPATAVDEIARRLRETCASFSTMEVKVDGLGCFPDFARPKVVWVGLQDTSCLEEMQRAIESAAADFGERASAGRGRQEAAWIPHLTLGRVRNISLNESRRLGRELQRWNLGRLGAWRIDRVVLMQSVLAPSGPSYQELASIPLSSNG